MSQLEKKEWFGVLAVLAVAVFALVPVGIYAHRNAMHYQVDRYYQGTTRCEKARNDVYVDCFDVQETLWSNEGGDRYPHDQALKDFRHCSNEAEQVFDSCKEGAPHDE